MKPLDFKPEKSEEAFRDNYKLHDIAENIGKSLLIQWGFTFENFGEDKRFEKLWEKGDDKPDIILHYNNKSALLDWKSKKTAGYLVNERAIKSYEKWQKELKMPVIIAFFVFDDLHKLLERHFAILPLHKYRLITQKQWDKNFTIEFENDLPVFNKQNIITYLLT